MLVSPQQPHLVAVRPRCRGVYGVDHWPLTGRVRPGGGASSVLCCGPLSPHHLEERGQPWARGHSGLSRCDGHPPPQSRGPEPHCALGPKARAAGATAGGGRKPHTTDSRGGARQARSAPLGRIGARPGRWDLLAPQSHCFASLAATRGVTARCLSAHARHELQNNLFKNKSSW